MVVVIVLLVISGVLKSKTMPNMSEWDACSKPLGVWASLWNVRLIMAIATASWKWRRERDECVHSSSCWRLLNIPRRASQADVELGTGARPAHTTNPTSPSAPTVNTPQASGNSNSSTNTRSLNERRFDPSHASLKYC